MIFLWWLDFLGCLSSSRFWRQTLQRQSRKKRSSGCSLLSVSTVHSSKNYSHPHKKKQNKEKHLMLTLFTKSVRTFWDMRYILLMLVTIQSTGWLQETTATGLVMLGVLSASESGWTVYRTRLSLTFGKSGGTVLQEEWICPHKSVATRFLAFPNLKTQETKVSNPMASRPLGPVHGFTGWRVGGGGAGGCHP